jgi:hypothetical protein
MTVVTSNGKRFICIDEFVDEINSHRKELAKLDSDKVLNIFIKSSGGNQFYFKKEPIWAPFFGMEKTFNLMMIFMTLGIWKLIDIIIWLVQHIHIGIN